MLNWLVEERWLEWRQFPTRLLIVVAFKDTWTAYVKTNIFSAFSISAEHGLGLKKANYIHYSQSETAVAYMKRLKQVFDPNGIMNPYKYLPRE